MQILLVEDNDINAMLANAALSKAGATISRAANGDIAVKMFAKKDASFDLVLMDMHMPVLDGIGATQKIREFENKQRVGKPVPIHALSADEQDSSQKEALNAGMDGFILKPVDPDALVALARKYS